ncbi:hypothetical protein EAI_06261 [Harpegnathos saltator]|uniref:Uncharacterized protein n=1 Tax=Harpegnathos saltator TaxID=610380 RepID=E2C0D4_HARSA|nr:hypothetical protein EAI_06261 [Harpegnathos saltator]
MAINDDGQDLLDLMDLRPRDNYGYRDAVSTDDDAAPEDPVRAEQSRLEDPQQNAADSVCCVSRKVAEVSSVSSTSDRLKVGVTDDEKLRVARAVSGKSFLNHSGMFGQRRTIGPLREPPPPPGDWL